MKLTKYLGVLVEAFGFALGIPFIILAIPGAYINVLGRSLQEENNEDD